MGSRTALRCSCGALEELELAAHASLDERARQVLDPLRAELPLPSVHVIPEGLSRPTRASTAGACFDLFLREICSCLCERPQSTGSKIMFSLFFLRFLAFFNLYDKSLPENQTKIDLFRTISKVLVYVFCSKRIDFRAILRNTLGTLVDWGLSAQIQPRLFFDTFSCFRGMFRLRISAYTFPISRDCSFYYTN